MQIIQKPHTFLPYEKKEREKCIWLPSTLFAYSFNGDITLFLCIIIWMHWWRWPEQIFSLYSRRVVCTWKQLREFMTISLVIFFFLHYSEQNLMMMLCCFTMPTWHRLERVYFLTKNNSAKCVRSKSAAATKKA